MVIPPSFGHTAHTRLARTLLVSLLAILGLMAGAHTAHAVQFGTWSPGEPYNGEIGGVNALEQSTGRRVEIVNWYQNWGGGDWIASVQPQIMNAVAGSGRTPLLSWEPWDPAKGTNQPEYRMEQVAAGRFDSYIASFARHLRDWGGTVYLRPMHEMNSTWYPWAAGVNGNSAADFVAAWRHMVEVMRGEGATNVKFVWAPNNVDVPASNRMENLYPGAAYVDVLGVDGYNWGSSRADHGGWQSFSEVFMGAYDRLKALGDQPIWITEVGTAPNGGDKAAWIKDMWARAATMDRLQAIVWFNENKEADWRANASAGYAAAFRPGNEAFLSVGSSTAKLVLSAPTRVSRSRTAVLRWRAAATTRAKSTRKKVRRWVVYLDGRRIRSMSAKKSPVVRKRVTRAGRHTWRVEGRAANGRKVLTGSKSFRVR